MTRGAVSTHSLFFKSSQSAQMLRDCSVVTIPPLLHELILYASLMKEPDETGANERLINVILDQVKELPSVAIFLPVADDPRLKKSWWPCKPIPPINAPLVSGGITVPS